MHSQRQQRLPFDVAGTEVSLSPMRFELVKASREDWQIPLLRLVRTEDDDGHIWVLKGPVTNLACFPTAGFHPMENA